MKVSAAALPFLILAAALGRPAHASLRPRSQARGIQPSGDCCFSYTPRNIRCQFMESYYTTSSACSQPAVIFTTKRGREVCVRPSADGVQECMEQLSLKNAVEK